MNANSRNNLAFVATDNNLVGFNSIQIVYIGDVQSSVL